MVPARDSFSYKKEIEQISKHQIVKITQNSFSITCITQWRETQQCIVSMNCAIYSLFHFSYLHAFYKPNNITTKPSLKVKSYFQSFDNET